MDTNKIYSDLKSQFPDIEIYQNHPLAPYTTVKIGGSADIFIHIKSSEEFKNILFFCRDARSRVSTDIPITILGNGSNTLISDSGIRGIVIKNDSQEIEILPNNQVKIDSGTQLILAIKFLAQHQLSGLEEFAYIPASIGGAIYDNIHGFDKTNFSQLIESIETFNLKTGEIKNINLNQSEWSYDHSPFENQPDLTIISAVLKLKPGNTQEIQTKADTIYKDKSTKQLMNSLGCVFKNPSPEICQKIWGEPKGTGWIIDHELNLKGYSIGDAQISPLHANFIINNGHATAADYLKLVKFIQTQAQEKLGITLEPEIKFLGQF